MKLYLIKSVNGQPAEIEIPRSTLSSAVLSSTSRLRETMHTAAVRHIGGREGRDFRFKQNNGGAMIPFYVASADGETCIQAR
jgi:hypothetical protein